MVAGSHLDRLPIRHHRLQSRGIDCALELLPLSLLPHQDWYGDLVFDESPIDLQNRHDFLFGLLLSLVHRVAFLPEKLAGANEGLGRSDLSTQDAVPDIDENRQVPPALHPSAVRFVDYRLGGGPDGEPLAELIVAGVCDPEDLGSEALKVFSFPLQ